MADSGYAITEAYLSNFRMRRLAARALSSDSIIRSRGGARHLMSNRAVAAVATDDRNMIRQLIVTRRAKKRVD
jgi:hypothetical protein